MKKGIKMDTDDLELIRDFAAFFAMNGLLADGVRDDVAHKSYEYADKMMKERSGSSVGLPQIKRRGSRYEL